MVIHLQQLYQIMSLFLLLLFIPRFAVFATDEVFINFGLPKSPQPISNNNRWLQSDENFAVTPSSFTAVTTLVGADAPYDVARIFMAPVTYSVPISSMGPKLVRLYFPSPSLLYNSIEMQNSFLNLHISGFEILSNFSSYLVASNAIANPNTTMPLSINNGYVREVYVTTTNSIDFTFAPSNPKGGFGLINGVEIVSVHDELYVNHSKEVTYLADTVSYYADNTYPFPKSLAMENIIRLNVGGNSINDPDDDTGIGRLWYRDDDYFLIYDANGIRSHTHFSNHSNEDVSKRIRYTKIPSYTAPKVVYATMRTVGPYYPKLKNLILSWKFEVDAGFNYLVRLHFCQLIPVKKADQMLFTIYINNQEVPQQMDVLASAGGQFIPIYKDFVTTVDDTTSNETRAILWVALHPNNFTTYFDAFLNGLEIFKLMTLNGSLAAPNPPALHTGVAAIPNANEDKKKAMVLGFSISLGTTILLIFCYGLFHVIRRWRQKKRKARFFKRNGGLLLQQQMTTRDNMVDRTKVFTDAELVKATDNYNSNRILGRGGQGTVYKGMLLDGRVVAIKKSLKVDESQIEHFINEVVILSQISHRNVVQLLGCCLETEVPLLVYEFIPNGTLSQHIQNPSEDFPFTWKMRLQIAVDSAGALAYLHSASATPIYHRDVKSSNILLDEKFRAKVADFGTSRTLAIDQTHLTTLVQGTLGYLDPEYFQTNQFTEKSDVYSFGVVLIELLTGQKPLTSEQSGGWKCLIVEFLLHMETSRLFDIIDPPILDEAKQEELFILASLAMRCLNLNGKHRPTMKEVVSALEGIRSSPLPDVAEHIYSTKETKEIMEKVKTDGIVGDLVASSMVYHSKNDIGPSSLVEVKPFMHYTI